MNWKKMFIAAMTRHQYKMFLVDTKCPEKASCRLWSKEILPLLEQSVYWSSILREKKYEALADFPITHYEDYETDLLAAQQTGVQPFNGEPLIFWSETSGTAGSRKFFPLTASFQKQFQRTIPPFIYNLTQRFNTLFKEKLLYLVAVDTHNTTPSGISSGWISHFNYRNLPALLKRFYAMPDEVFANKEVYEQWAPLYALACDLSAIFAVTPMVIETFYHRCAERFDDYLPYLMGFKRIPTGLPAVKISKKRQQYLQQLANTSKRSFSDLWPSLALTGCWISGLCEYPAQKLQQLMGPKIKMVDGTYSATEGWLTVPLEPGALGGILHPGTHIVEFIEEGKEINRDNLIPGWQLQVGKNYEVFLTTAMGFVRYQLKDIVKCTGFLNKAPQLVFCYKTQILKLEECAVTGQELQEIISTTDFAMAPHWFFARNSSGNRIVLVTDDSVEVSQLLLNSLHQHLMQISPAYNHHVTIGALLPMVLWQLPKDVLLADAHGQTKPKLISQQVIEEV